MSVTQPLEAREIDTALLVASVAEDPGRGRHPAVLRLRERRAELAALLERYPAVEHRQAASGLYVDGDGALRTRHRQLRPVDG